MGVLPSLPEGYHPHAGERVRQEILSLSEPDLLRLRQYAKWRIRGLGRIALGRDHNDLLHEALTAIIDGRRPWPPEIKFIAHLRWCMRSISNSWLQKCHPDLWFDSELPYPKTAIPQEEALFPVHTAPDPERAIAVAELLEKVYRLFPKETTERKIIDCWKTGETKIEVCSSLCLSSAAYDAAAKRIRRTVAQRIVAYKEGLWH